MFHLSISNLREYLFCISLPEMQVMAREWSREWSPNVTLNHISLLLDLSSFSFACLPFGRTLPRITHFCPLPVCLLSFPCECVNVIALRSDLTFSSTFITNVFWGSHLSIVPVYAPLPHNALEPCFSFRALDSIVSRRLLLQSPNVFPSFIFSI